MTKTCNKCGEGKPLDAFSVDRQAKDGRSYSCKSCRKKRDAEYRASGKHKKHIDQSNKPWFNCSCCIAKVGLGHKKAACILSHVSPGQIHTAWSRGGIKVDKPSAGSWRLHAQRIKKGRCPEKKINASDIAYEAARMADIRKAHGKGFTWIYIWQKAKASRHTSAKYHALTPEEKKKHNKKCYKKRIKRFESNPEAKRRAEEQVKQWKRENKDKMSKYIKKSNDKRKKKDPGFKVLCNMRRRMRDVMKSTKKGGTVIMSELIGCTTKKLASHLESQFTTGMSWENYGLHGWHVDHILPCASFDHTDPEQVKQCWHYTNLQPLWAEDNLAKSDKIIYPPPMP